MAGLLVATMHPLLFPPARFNDWYNNEHAPSLLRVSYIRNGARFRATGLTQVSQNDPEWLAVYDVDDVDGLQHDPTYASLRAKPQSDLDKEVTARIVLDRAIYRLEKENIRSDSFVPLESLSNDDARGASLVTILVTVPRNRASGVVTWYDEQVVGPFSQTPGWRRSRLFSRPIGKNNRDTNDPESESVRFLILVELASPKALIKSLNLGFPDMRLRTFEWFYTFGPAPRDLSSLAAITPQQQKQQEYREQQSGRSWTWTSYDHRTRAFRHHIRPIIESVITTTDGVDIPYRLEGGCGKNISFTTGSSYHPLLLLSNPILTDWSIWDYFVDRFLAAHPRWRVLRYLTRGRLPLPSEKPMTVNVLSSDVLCLLDALRVPKAALLVGVSLGGITVLNTSLLYPKRVGAFVAADMSPSANESNQKAWEDRIALAEKDQEADAGGSADKKVGSKLASAMAHRWLIPDTFSKKPDLAHRIEKIVAANSLQGLRSTAPALYDYDIRERMARTSVTGLFVAGAEDGSSPQSMKQMAADLKPSAQLKIIEGTGHLPMVEQPDSFFGVVNGFVDELNS